MSSTASAAPGAVPAAIETSDVSVLFGDFVAVQGVSLGWQAGTINVIVGQNGAGKTTLARVLGGLQRPSQGTVHLHGANLAVGDVVEARHRGIELVHQHFALPASFTVAQALELFNAGKRPGGLFSRNGIRADARRQLAAGGLDISPDALVGDLSVETLQALEITRALASSPTVLVLDEPTAVLSPQETERLFDRLRALASTGICILLVLHKLSEVFAIAETIAVLREGRLVLAPTPAGELDRREVAKAIVGRTVVQAAGAPPVPAEVPPLLRLRDASAVSGGHDARLDDVSLDIRPGEIVGVAGVEGNGQRSLVEAIVGIADLRPGTLTLGTDDLTSLDVRGRRRLGVRAVPFERNTEGVSKSSALWENHAMLRRRGDGFVLRVGQARTVCRAALDHWEVRYSSVDQKPSELSGGNVQKTILARELSGDVRCLVAAHPTRGLDLAATESVRRAITAAAGDGAAVLLVSADLDELFQLSHRVIVLSGGRIAGDFAPPWDLDAVGWAMTGGQPE